MSTVVTVPIAPEENPDLHTLTAISNVVKGRITVIQNAIRAAGYPEEVLEFALALMDMEGHKKTLGLLMLLALEIHLDSPPEDFNQFNAIGFMVELSFPKAMKNDVAFMKFWYGLSESNYELFAILEDLPLWGEVGDQITELSETIDQHGSSEAGLSMNKAGLEREINDQPVTDTVNPGDSMLTKASTSDIIAGLHENPIPVNGTQFDVAGTDLHVAGTVQPGSISANQEANPQPGNVAEGYCRCATCGNVHKRRRFDRPLGERHDARKVYTPDQKAEAVRRVAAGETKLNVAERIGATRETVARWVLEARVAQTPLVQQTNTGENAIDGTTTEIAATENTTAGTIDETEASANQTDSSSTT